MFDGRRPDAEGRARRNPLVPLAAVALFALVFAGCGEGVEPFAIPKALLLGVLVALKEKKKLRFSEAEDIPSGEREKSFFEMLEDRQKGFFIFRRTESIGKRNGTLDKNGLIAKVEPQFDAVVTYLNDLIGPGRPLSDFFEPGGQSTATNEQPFSWSVRHHFDLKNVAIGSFQGKSGGREFALLRDRLVNIRAIVWIAAAIHDELWSSNGDGALDTAKLDHVLHRRLRSIERMHLQVNGPSYAVQPMQTPRPRGPWFDGGRIRCFQYPYFLKSLVATSDIGKIWRDAGGDQVEYENVAFAKLNTRFDEEPGAISSRWRPDVNNNYKRRPADAVLIASSLDELFKSQFDIWKRTWLFCDQSISAIHLEALRFALRRVDKTDTDFEDLVRPKNPILFGILGNYGAGADGTISMIDTGDLFSDGVFTPPTDTGTFDNLMVKYRDLQVGDHLIFWNHPLYDFVASGPWRLENAFVTYVDPVVDNWDEDVAKVDPAQFMKPRLQKLQMEGFGGDHNYREWEYELWHETLVGYRAIFDLIPDPPTVEAFRVPRSNTLSAVFRWQVYDTGLDRMPWFLFLPLTAIWPTKELMHKFVTNSIIDGPNRGAGYHPPPTKVHLADGLEIDITAGVYFPLFVPEGENGAQMSWDRYFQIRAGNNPPAFTRLRPLTLAPETLPGLFKRGQSQPIEIIRPRVPR
jgi:hypothetical protein